MQFGKYRVSLKLLAFGFGVTMVLAKEFNLLSMEAVEEITQLAGIYILGQGMADWGKNKIK